jgi:glycosyltransferase involved in cell wall biosynthesis
MARFLRDRPEQLLLDYHNITPSRFYIGWDSVAAASMDAARIELRDLATSTDLALADSAYNEAELIEIGYRSTAVSPLLIDFNEYRAVRDARVLDRLRRSRQRRGAHWLFVGRVAPNKCQHDVIGAFAAYRRLFDPKAQLTLVGGITSRLYWTSLQQLIGELELEQSVHMADLLPLSELVAHFAIADAFVCLSEHEGFCIPILEAMDFGVPVVAYRAAAVPDTLGDAGVLLLDKDPVVVACAVREVLEDKVLRDGLVAAGRNRVEEFSLTNTANRFMEVLAAYLGPEVIQRDA